MAKPTKKATAPKPDAGSAVLAREPRTSVTSGWSPERLSAADAQCNYGNFQFAADLCEAMFSDERVGKCQNRLYSATTLPLAFKLPGLDDKASANDPVCQALQTDWWRIIPEQTMKTAVRWLTLFGAFLAHIDGHRKDEETGRVLPIVTPWSPRNLRHDPREGWQARVSTDGGDSYGVWESITPGDGNWILIVAGSDWRAPYQSPWRGISRWWLLGKLCSPIDWAASSERHGQGEHFVTNTLTGNAADADTGDELGKTAKAAICRDISDMGRNGTVVLPRGWTAELVTDGANTYETFAKQTEFANMAIDIGLTGTNLTTEVSGGSRAAASVHATVDAGVMRGLLELLATGIREQILVYWVRYNFATGIAPYPTWDTTPPEDRKATAEARKADAEALKTYREAGLQLNQLAWVEGRIELVKGATEAFPEMVKSAPPANGNALPPVEPDPAKPPKKARARAKTLALGEVVALKSEPATAFAAGREYVDELERSLAALVAKGLAPTVAAVTEAVTGATSYEDAQLRLIEAYRNAKPIACKSTERALVMAQLAGRDTVETELLTEE